MALNYSQSASLRTNTAFQGRIAIAAQHWADYLLGGSINAADPVARRKFQYALTVYQNGIMIATQLQPLVASDSNIQAADIDPTTGDSTIDDATLQTAVETAIGKVV